MGIFEEITQLSMQGKSEQEISLILQREGYSMQDISTALNQARIKQAISQDNSSQPELMEAPQPIQELQQSVMNTPAARKERREQEGQSEEEQASQTEEQQQIPQPMQQQEASYPEPGQYPQQQYQQALPPQLQQEYAGYYDNGYQQYAPQQTSSDNISEIAEQVVVEKLSPLKNKLDSILDMKNTYDAKISSLDERLKRIEKIIDRLQLSILQKVGENLTNIEDIKKEMQETQKSFKALLNQGSNYKQL